MEQNKRLPLVIPADLYRRLERAAEAEDRDPIQQARVIIRRALEALEAQENESQQ